MAAWCFIIPNVFAAWFIWWESYPHHLHVPTTSLYDGSVTIMSPKYNRHTYNIGHHTAHHEKPTLHWSLLPQRTAQIRDRMPDQCVHEVYDRSARKQAEETLRKMRKQATRAADETSSVLEHEPVFSPSLTPS
jgi:fatty acid desaturase